MRRERTRCVERADVEHGRSRPAGGAQRHTAHRDGIPFSRRIGLEHEVGVDPLEHDRPLAGLRRGRRSRHRAGCGRPVRPLPRFRPPPVPRARSSDSSSRSTAQVSASRIVADARQEDGQGDPGKVEVGKRRLRHGLQVLEPLASAPLGFEHARMVDRECGAIGGELEQLRILVRRTARGCFDTQRGALRVTTPCRRVSGTPSIDLIPFSRRIGLRTSGVVDVVEDQKPLPVCWRALPAKPCPNGMRMPRSTSSSSPTGGACDELARFLVEEQDLRRCRPRASRGCGEAATERSFFEIGGVRAPRR